MSIERSVVIKNRLGTSIFTIDGDDGIRDNVNNGLVSFFDRVTVPLFATMVDTFVWTCHNGVWVVADVVEAHSVVGGAGANVQVVVCPGSGTIASGTGQLTSALDLTITAPAKSFGTLITTPTEINRGDSIAIDMNGTLTNLVGVLSLLLKRVK